MTGNGKRHETATGGARRVGPFAELVDQLPRGGDALRAAGFDFLRHGHAPSVEDLATATGVDLGAVQSILAALVGRGAAELDGDGRLVGIGGLSLVPTGHELVIDGVSLHTWCAVDALGIPAALSSDATARTHCQHCGQPIQVTFATGTPTGSSPIITWYPHAACTDLRRNFCDAANAFCSSDHLAAWRIAHGDPTGESLTLSQVTARGRAIWGPESQC